MARKSNRNNGNNNQSKPKTLPYTFENHRHHWNSKSFYEKIFGNGKGDCEKAKDLQKKLLSMPVKESFNIVGYGSLMNGDDAYRTINESWGFPVYVPGFERIFNMGYLNRGSFLNVRHVDPQESEEMAAIMYQIKWDKLPDLLIREGLYEVETVPVIETLTQEVHEALIVVGGSNVTDEFIQPQLNYLHLCMSGIKEQFGMEGLENFLKTTKAFCPKLTKIVTIEEWLAELNPLEYIMTHDYSPR